MSLAEIAIIPDGWTTLPDGAETRLGDRRWCRDLARWVEVAGGLRVPFTELYIRKSPETSTNP